MRTFPRAFLAYLASLLAIAVAAFVLWLTGHSDIAWWVSYPGSFLVTMVALGHIIFSDSRRRWPGSPWLVRLYNVLTFRAKAADQEQVEANRMSLLYRLGIRQVKSAGRPKN